MFHFPTLKKTKKRILEILHAKGKNIVRLTSQFQPNYTMVKNPPTNFKKEKKEKITLLFSFGLPPSPSIFTVLII